MAAEAILYVADLDVMAAFYRECIGLKAVDHGDGYCELRADGMTLSLVKPGRHR
jgi:catechol-2,3-dioxygenase